MKKLKDSRGETLVESLASILIAVLAFAVLATTVTTAEKINAQTRNTDVMFHYAEQVTKDDATVRLQGQSGKSGSGTAALYENNGYYYYDSKTGAGA